MDAKKKHKLISLFEELRQDDISQERLLELDRILKEDASAKRLYLEYSYLDPAIFRLLESRSAQSTDPDHDFMDVSWWSEMAEYEKTAEAVEIPKEQPPPELIQKVVYPPRKKYKPSKFQIFTLAASAAAVLLFVLFVKFAPEPLPSVEVATLTDQMNVQWDESSFEPETGSRLWTDDGPLGLKKGIVSIACDKGVEVVIEGPAVFDMERSGVFLEYGRLYSVVSETGSGFTVETPTSQFVDLGTEFGVQADIDGSSELHVTKGRVQLFAGSKGKSRTSRMVTANLAVRFQALSGLIKDIPIRKTAFVRKINSASNSVWKGQQLPSDNLEPDSVQWHNIVWRPVDNPASDAIIDGKADWNNPKNWTAGVPEFSDVKDKAVLNASGGAECIVSDAQSCEYVAMGDNEQGGVLRIVDGGKLTVTGAWMAVGYNRPAALIVEAGGVCDVVAGDLMVGYENADGCVVQINGGTVRVAVALEVGKYGSTGKVYVNEGVLEFNRFSSAGFETGSLIDIKFGTVIVNGDKLKKTEAFIADGILTAFGGSGTVVCDYDVTNPGKTTITARQKSE